MLIRFVAIIFLRRMWTCKSLMGWAEWQDCHSGKANSGRTRVPPAACALGECGAHRTCYHSAPEAPHSSGQGGSMFYVRENWSGRFRERLTRAILQVPHNMQRRITPRLG